ncbi:hypothetical protein V493_06484 [Pseudogymnoascus sp. VKM F-4281 (FW-2241)]|nr:hypothetical protein V493_06484 [Pseudogymnoascus sp. VKM F-4281 (FW-2241)]
MSHRIVGRDVDINEERMFDLLPPPDPELHIRTWRSLSRVYSKASIVEMVRGLDREEFMEFARIIMIGLPVTSIADMRRRGMMEDIQRVTGVGISDDFHQRYDDECYDQRDDEDESVFDPDSYDIEDPFESRRHSYRRIEHAAEISSDEPMEDHPFRVLASKRWRRRGAGVTRSICSPPLPLPPPTPADFDSALPALLSNSNSRPFNSIYKDKAQRVNKTKIRRFRECLAAAYSTVDGPRAKLGEGVLDKYAENAPVLARLFEYDTMLKGVFDLLQESNCSIPPVCSLESRSDADIPTAIYRVVGQIGFTGENTAQSRLHEAHNYLDFNRVFEAEVVRRSALSPVASKNGDGSVLANVKFDIACAVTKLSRRELTATQSTDPEILKTAITRGVNLRQCGIRVSAYTNAMGSSAALLIWPWLPMQALTPIPLFRLQHVLIEAVSRFLLGSNEYRAIRALVDHLSTWFEGWMNGSISSKTATQRLKAFLKPGDEAKLPPKGLEIPQLARNSRDEPTDDLRKLIEMFRATPRADNATYSTVGIGGHIMSLDITDMESLGGQRQLTERAIEAVLATTKFLYGVMLARASGYGSLYDQREYEHERSMPIDKRINTILCPVHTGSSRPHWVGVVVRLDFLKRERPGISMTLLDSLAIDANSAIYDEQVIKKIVITWLRHRLPDFKSFAINGELARPRVEQQADLNSCGVHMLLNLRAAGLNGKYISKGDNCTDREWIDDARESFIRRILRSAGKHLGGDIERKINELLDEPGGGSGAIGTD